MRSKMAIAVAAFAAASVASADGIQKDRGKGHGKHGDDTAASRDAKFRSWDKDGNGSLSRGEYPGHPGNFRALDTNNDGGLTPDEFRHRAGGGAPPEARAETAAPSARDEAFKRLDADGDGAIARAEWRGRPSAFDALDTDKNGTLSREEYARGSGRGRLTK
jgi:Ca2+-binding EF-hand superfamily protein